MFNSNSLRWPDIQQHQLSSVMWLLCLSFLFIATGIGLRDPWPADEPRFAQIAKEMVESGQWLFPMRGGELYPDKPPIFMWLIALIYGVSDSMRLAFLLPSAIAGVITVWAVYDIARRLWTPVIGWYAALTLLMSVQFALQTKSAQIDATVTMWITLGCYGVLRATLCGHVRWWLFACIFMALGIMTKGVGFLPLLMLVPYCWLRYRQKQGAGGHRLFGLSTSAWLSGVLLLFITLLLWLVPMWWAVESAQDPAFTAYRDNIMLKQTVTRYADSWHHIKPFWYYLTSVIPWAWMPVVLFLPWLYKPLVKAIKNHDPKVIMPLGFVLLLFVFFSITSGKRGVYILPGLPMLILAIAPFLPIALARKGVVGLVRSVIFLLSGLLLAAGVLALFGVSPMAKLIEKYEIHPGAMFCFIGIVGAGTLLMSWRRNALIQWAGFFSVLILTYSTWGAQLLNATRTPKNVVAAVSHSIAADSTVAFIGTGEQFMLFAPFAITHFGYHTPQDTALREAWAWQGNNSSRYVLIPFSNNVPCYDMTKSKEMGFAHRAHWMLLDTGARLNQCKVTKPGPSHYHYVPNKVIN